jgi:hypothetical protein
MPYTLTSTQASGPLHVSLASGATVRLGPGETSAELPDVEVQSSPTVQKLRDRGVLQVRTVEQRGGGRSRGSRKVAKDDAAKSDAAKDDTTGSEPESGS